MDRVPVAILGATGLVGQTLCRLLRDHPYFDLVALAASDQSVGRKLHGFELQPCAPGLAGELIFSALPSSVAAEQELRFVEAGYTVISNASAARMRPDVPLLVPEVNGSQLGQARWICNPNCVVAGLVLALKPLADAFGLEAVQVCTLQALSGAGQNGVAAMDILANVLPAIRGEEDKIETEPQKILDLPDLKISAQVNRVPVRDGHLMRVSVRLGRRASVEEVRCALESFEGLRLPSSPARPLQLLEAWDAPQPLLHSDLDGGMAVAVGQLESCPVLDVKFALLSHNLIRGAAGAALLNAELVTARRHGLASV